MAAKYSSFANNPEITFLYINFFASLNYFLRINSQVWITESEGRQLIYNNEKQVLFF